MAFLTTMMIKKELDRVMLCVSAIALHTSYIILCGATMDSLQKEGKFDYIGLAVMEAGPRLALISILSATLALILNYALIFNITKKLCKDAVFWSVGTLVQNLCPKMIF